MNRPFFGWFARTTPDLGALTPTGTRRSLPALNARPLLAPNKKQEKNRTGMLTAGNEKGCASDVRACKDVAKSHLQTPASELDYYLSKPQGALINQNEEKYQNQSAQDEFEEQRMQQTLQPQKRANRQ